MSPVELCEYAGRYQITPAIATTVRCVAGGLVSERAERPAATYRPGVRDVFFDSGKPRSRRIFLRDGEGRIIGFADRREGEDVRWQRSGAAPD